MLYVDTSALLKIYFDETDGDASMELLRSDADWVSARLTSVEVRRNVARELDGSAAVAARDQFQRDWRFFTVIELDRGVCDMAAQIAETTGVRTLDALHLGAAQRLGGGSLPILTYDLRQAQAARTLGWTVLGS